MSEEDTRDLLHATSEGSRFSRFFRYAGEEERRDVIDKAAKYRYKAGSWECRFVLFLAEEGVLSLVEDSTKLVMKKDLPTYLSERSFLDYFDEDVNSYLSRVWKQVSNNYFDVNYSSL
jgi:hypothetical protein